MGALLAGGGKQHRMSKGLRRKLRWSKLILRTLVSYINGCPSHHPGWLLTHWTSSSLMPVYLGETGGGAGWFGDGSLWFVMLLWRFVTSASCSLRSCGPDRLAIIRFNRKFAGSGTGAGTGAGTYAISISTTLALISIHSTSFFRILYWMCHWLNWSLISFPYLFLYAHTFLKSLSLSEYVVPLAYLALSRK